MSQTQKKAWDEKVIDCCRRQGMDVASVEQKGTVLVLHPAPKSEIPPSSVLAELADAIDVDNIRYVTLGLDGFGQGVSDE